MVGKRSKGALKRSGGGERHVSARAPMMARHLDGGLLRIQVLGGAGEAKAGGKSYRVQVCGCPNTEPCRATGCRWAVGDTLTLPPPPAFCVCAGRR